MKEFWKSVNINFAKVKWSEGLYNVHIKVIDENQVSSFLTHGVVSFNIYICSFIRISVSTQWWTEPVNVVAIEDNAAVRGDT